MKNIPTLKSHLQEEWDKLVRRAKLANKRKRMLPDPTEPPVGSSSTSIDHGEDGAAKPDEKRTKIEEPKTD